MQQCTNLQINPNAPIHQFSPIHVKSVQIYCKLCRISQRTEKRIHRKIEKRRNVRKSKSFLFVRTRRWWLLLCFFNRTKRASLTRHLAGWMPEKQAKDNFLKSAKSAFILGSIHEYHLEWDLCSCVSKKSNNSELPPLPASLCVWEPFRVRGPWGVAEESRGSSTWISNQNLRRMSTSTSTITYTSVYIYNYIHIYQI